MNEAYMKEIFPTSTNTRVFHNSFASFGFADFHSYEVACKALDLLKGSKMPKSDRHFKINWATQSNVPKKTNKASVSKVQTDNSSWADKLKISDSTTRFNLSEVETKVENDVLIIPDEVIADGHQEWSRCMVGYFPGYTMPFHAARSVAFRAWKSEGLEEVTSSGTGFLIFRFQTEEAIHSILERGPWMFGGRTIILQQWNAQMSFDKTKIKKIPVWTRLYGIHMPLWTPQGLSQISSRIGRPLSCDKTTSERTRLSYARVYVELDAAIPPKHQILIQSSLSENHITITVEYEWKPSRCPKCCVFGHFCRETSTTSKTTQVYVPVAKKTSQEAPISEASPPVPTTENTSRLQMVAVTSLSDGRADSQSSDSDIEREDFSPHPLEADQDRLMLTTPCILSREHTSPFSRDSPFQDADSTPLPIQVIAEVATTSNSPVSTFSKDSPHQAADSAPLPIQVISEVPSTSNPPASKGRKKKVKGSKQ